MKTSGRLNGRGKQIPQTGVCTHHACFCLLPLQKDWESLMQQFVRYDGMFEYDKLCKQIEYKLGNPVINKALNGSKKPLYIHKYYV